MSTSEEAAVLGHMVFGRHCVKVCHILKTKCKNITYRKKIKQRARLQIPMADVECKNEHRKHQRLVC